MMAFTVPGKGQNLEGTIEEIGDQLLEEVKRFYAENGKLSDDLLGALNFIYKAPLLSALELVEKQLVTCVVSPSGRQLFQVVGASGTPYTCFPKLKYCSCPAYHFSVLRKEDHILCKHVLAMRLSVALGLSKSLQVSDAEISHMIMAID